MTNDTEASFIGMLLENPEEHFPSLTSYPKSEWFINKDLGKVSAALEMSASKDAKIISQISGVDIGSLLSLQLDAPISHSINAYATEIFSNYKSREIKKIAEKWLNKTNADKDFFEMVDHDIESITKTNNGIHELIFANEIIDNWLSDKEDRISGKIKPLKTHFPSIDQAFSGGLHPELLTVAGRPGSGKSAFLKSMFLRMLNNDLKIAVFSIEMVPNEYLDRLCSEAVGIDSMRLKDAACLDDGELDKLTAFAGEFYKKTFSFNSIQSNSVVDIERLSKAAKVRLGGLDIIFIDHLHIIEPHNHKLDKKEHLSDVTRRLKRLSQELKLPIVLAAQCNRESERRDNKMPKMSDLEGSGGIEQNSNAIIFVHRPGLTDQDISPSNAEIHISKNRHGPSPKKLSFRFVQNLTAFEEVDVF